MAEQDFAARGAGNDGFDDEVDLSSSFRTSGKTSG